jgi:hypothetical protein
MTHAPQLWIIGVRVRRHTADGDQASLDSDAKETSVSRVEHDAAGVEVGEKSREESEPFRVSRGSQITDGGEVARCESPNKRLPRGGHGTR